jgi:hypothetical protein
VPRPCLSVFWRDRAFPEPVEGAVFLTSFAILILLVQVGHSCPTPLTLFWMFPIYILTLTSRLTLTHPVHNPFPPSPRKHERRRPKGLRR